MVSDSKKAVKKEAAKTPKEKKEDHVFEEVKTEIEESFKTFENNSASVKSTLESLEEKRINFINSALNKSSLENFSIIALKEESKNKINSLTFIQPSQFKYWLTKKLMLCINIYLSFAY